ncbi:MGDG synthase family glycosyltransferase [Nocardioides terrisoli]|uniref:MGDG synthase family glycosyltransferase n=1 Tax=Nocardioides terrisoli TaxID=3388267 RepID=UPI00287BC6D5|nr:hypothetical protein [Nocardioides marmorisolisilvae]
MTDAPPSDLTASGMRVLVLSAAMGGGHLQIARELARRLAERGHDVEVVDLLDLMPRLFARFLGWVYPWLVNRAPSVYQMVYDTFFVADQTAGERADVPVRAALPQLRQWVGRNRPDLTVSTYPLCSLALGELRVEGTLSCPAVTVVTTFSVNNLWVHPGIDRELCISEPAAADAARRTGRRADVVGPVVRPGFDAPADPELRDRLGVPPDRRLAVVSTGSMGLSGSATHAASVIATIPGWTPLVLCGRSTRVRREVRRIDGAIALDWVSDMQRLLASADALVDNNCGMTAKESLAAGLPVVTFRPLPGHGRDDARAMEELGLTQIVHTDEQLVGALLRLAGSPQTRHDRARRGRALFVADAAAHLEEQLLAVR